MKTKLFFIFLFFCSLNYPQNKNIGNKAYSYDQIEQSYIAGLSSDNFGLKISCAYFLGEIKSSKAVIPLMAMLRSSESETERLVAALSLTKIGDERGIFLLKHQAEFCDCERVRCMCERFYNAFIMEKYSDAAKIAIEGDPEFIKLTSTIDPNLKLTD